METEISSHGVSIYDYGNFRDFLRDTYLRAKATNRKFSFRYFARIAGFSSSNFLMLVMNGRRNLSPESAGQIARGLKLNKEETEFFANLVRLNQAKAAEDRQLYAQALVRSRTFKKLHPLKESQFNYYKHWYFVLVRELVGLPGFKEDPEWISARTIPQITPAEARRAIEELLALGLIKRGPRGRLVQSEAKITTSDEVASGSIAHFHREMMKRAAEAIDAVPRENREVSSVTFLTSRESARKVKEMIQNFRKEIVQVLSGAETPDCVYQLNFQLFPLAKTDDGKGGSE
jgi:uncharacterized protein (TIGR02147 family)